MNAVTQPFTPTAGAVSSDAASPTMADAILAVAGWSTRSERRRGDIISSLKTAARIIGKRPEEVLLDPPALRAVLTGRPARTYGLEPKRYQNVLSDLRNVLRTLHISCPKVPGGQIPGHWGEVLAAASSNWERMRLVRFARFCESSQIEPTQVDDTAVERFADHEARTEVAANMGTRAWGATRSWNAISTRRPDLGLRTVALRRRFNQYTVPETSFSATFIADLDTWCRRAMRGDPADVFADLDVGQPDAPLAPLRQLRASTVALRRRQVILAASALVHAGRDPSTIRTLRDLVEPWETVRTIAQIHYNRRSSEATTGVYGILEALRQIAKHYVCVDPTLLRQITLLRNRVTPRRAGISKRNRERLRPLEDMRHRAALLHLPAELLRQAASARNERRRKRLATCAAALEILLICPMRISNLAGLRLDRHFRYALGGRRQLTHIVIDGAETKAGVPIDWPVPPASLPVIDAWLNTYRVADASPGCPFVFQGNADGPRPSAGLRQVLEEEIARCTGLQIHPHLLRHFAALLFLRHNPGHYEEVRRVLGHRSLKTTVDAYMPAEADAAAQRFDAVVMKERSMTKVLAQQALGRKRMSRPAVGRRRPTPSKDSSSGRAGYVGEEA